MIFLSSVVKDNENQKNPSILVFVGSSFFTYLVYHTQSIGYNITSLIGILKFVEKNSG